jgi:hypothetical protein
MGARRVGDAQAGAEVVRIGDAVEHQQQRRALDAVEQLGQVLRERNVLDARDDALMALGMREPPDAFRRPRSAARPLPSRRAGTPACGDRGASGRQHLRNRRRIVPHTCGHRMETVKNLQT